MPSRKSEFAVAVDSIQVAVRPLLKEHGFKVRGRTFNRVTDDGLTQVIKFQMGASDPPGTTYIPGLRENLHGLFTVNLGVFVPEVADLYMGRTKASWIQDYDCCVRARIGEVCGEAGDLWWRAISGADVVDDVRLRIKGPGLSFLGRYDTRNRILSELRERSDRMSASHPPRIVSAIILATQGHKMDAKTLLARQAEESRETHPGHAEFVEELALKIGVGSLEG